MGLLSLRSRSKSTSYQPDRPTLPTLLPPAQILAQAQEGPTATCLQPLTEFPLYANPRRLPAHAEVIIRALARPHQSLLAHQTALHISTPLQPLNTAYTTFPQIL